MPPRFRTSLLFACLLVLACLAPAGALAASNGTGGISPSDARYAPAKKAKIVNGMAVAPRGAPPQVVNAIAAANRIIRKPYRYGGGHRSFNDSGYDCSGSVSYALHGAGLLRSPLDSSSLMSYGRPGRGRHITIYSNPGHAFMVVDGRRFDTSAMSETGGSRWSNRMRSTSGYFARHPAGF